MESVRARVFRFGAFELDVRSGELRKHDIKIRLQEQPLRILLMLLEHPGEVVLREEIRKRLWPNDTIVEFDHSINAAIKRLRDALGDSAGNPRYVETVERRGYRFLGAVEVVPQGPAEAVPPALAIEAAGDLTGKTVSHYRVLARLGSGGMGVVYKAQDLKLGREVALKFLSEELTADPTSLKRFEREARAASALNHPNICTIYGVEEDAGQPIIAMELVPGETLAERIKRGSMPLDEALNIAKQMAEALEAAHENGIVHRDLKPDNVKIKPDGTVKVLDFGLAKLVEAAAPAGGPEDSLTMEPSTRAGVILGTAAYMSPEQARGAAVDKRTDIWAFGAVLYELLAGRRAFDGTSVSDTLAAVLKTEPDFQAIPARMQPLLQRCLQKDERQRLRDIGDARIALDEMSGVAAWRRLAPKQYIVSLAALAMVAIGALVGWWRSTQPMDLSRYRYTPFAVSLPEGQSMPFWSPDGKSVAYTGVVKGHQQAFVRNLNAPDATQLTSDSVEGSIVLGWTPDNKRVLVLSPGPNAPETKKTFAIFSIAVVGGEPEMFCPLPDYLYTAMPPFWQTLIIDISPDNQTVAIFGQPPGRKNTVLVSSPPGSPYRQYEPAPFASQTAGNPCFLRFSPNGKKVILSCTVESGLEDAWLLPYPPGSSAPRRIFTHFPPQRGTGYASWMADSRHAVLELGMSPQNDQRHLWMADTESDESYQITGGIATQGEPAISPDGRRIIYCEQTDDLDITSVSLADGRSTKLIATDVYEQMPAWSAGTPKFAYVTNRNGPMEIWMRSGDGSDQPLVTQKEFPGNLTGFLTGPLLSPDGKRLVFTRGSAEGASRTWILSLGTAAPPELLNDFALGNAGEIEGAWSPDGLRFAELADSMADSGSNTRLTIVKVGSREKPAVLREHLDPRLPDSSPTGEWLTFRENREWNLISPDGKSIKPLGKISSDHLAFSKDGALLYGIRNEQDKLTLFSIDVANLRVTDIADLITISRHPGNTTRAFVSALRRMERASPTPPARAGNPFGCWKVFGSRAGYSA